MVCINYRALIQVMNKDIQPLPRIDELLDDVARHDLSRFVTSIVLTIK